MTGIAANCTVCSANRFRRAVPLRTLLIVSILGHGIDLVETARIQQMVAEHGQRFLDRCFTAAEQEYSARSQKRYFEHLAGRFAAKEAVLKVLGTGWRGGIAWTDIEVTKEPSGQPRVLLHGECARLAQQMHITHWHVSISHIETHAVASAIGWRDEPTPSRPSHVD